MRPYRHEQKYYISRQEYELLSRRLRLTMDRDRFAAARADGRYHIRSLYFDDYENGAVVEKLSGSDSRDKYRIRIYNYSDKTIKLERKHKEGPYIQKQSLILSREECDEIIAGNFGVLLGRREAFAKQVYVAFRTRQLKPKVIVEYWREAYVFPIEDVRITFDIDIRTAMRQTDLFNRDLPTYPVVDGYGMVLEVKFNRYLPGYIQALIQPGAAQRSAISKYVICRKYEF